MTASALVVAIINTSEDTIDMLRMAFERAGFVVVSAFTHAIRDGQVDLQSFVRQHQPDVVVYDIAIPYDSNFRLYEHLRQSPACRDLPFVLTTTNVARVREAARTDEPLHEIVGKPYDLDQLIGIINCVVRQ